MNKFFSVLFVALLFSLPVFSDDIKDVECFFNEYVDAANSYSDNYFNYYTNNAKIVRVVEKPDGTVQAVDIPFERYKIEAKTIECAGNLTAANLSCDQISYKHK